MRDRARLRPRLGLHAEPAADPKIVIVEAGAETVGVVVVAIEEVLTVEDTQIDDVPGTGGDGADAIARIGDRLVVLLSPARLFDGLGAVAA